MTATTLAKPNRTRRRPKPGRRRPTPAPPQQAGNPSLPKADPPAPPADIPYTKLDARPPEVPTPPMGTLTCPACGGGVALGSLKGEAIEVKGITYYRYRQACPHCDDVQVACFQRVGAGWVPVAAVPQPHPAVKA